MKLVITVTPSRNPDGTRACSNRGQLFDAAIEDTPLVRRSTQPFLDGCRALIAAGADPDTPVAMRNAGADHNALTSTVGAAAKLTVKEGDRAPYFSQWEPSPHARVNPPIGLPEAQARGVADKTENSPAGWREPFPDSGAKIPNWFSQNPYAGHTYKSSDGVPPVQGRGGRRP